MIVKISSEGVRIISPVEPEKSVLLNALGAFLDGCGDIGLPMTQKELSELIIIWGATNKEQVLTLA